MERRGQFFSPDNITGVAAPYTGDILVQTNQNQDEEEIEKIHHNCGIAGIYINEPGTVPADNIISMLRTLQPRGQEGSGVFALPQNGNPILIKAQGLVRDIYTDIHIKALRENNPKVIIGQDRYSTSGSLLAWQPFAGKTTVWTPTGEKTVNVAMVHNGNFINPGVLARQLPTDLTGQTESDTWVIHQSILSDPGNTLEEKIINTVSQCEGAYNVLIAGESEEEQKLYAIRDPWGMRPLVIGELADYKGFVIASETSALAPIGARLLREVLPGEGVVIDQEGVKTFYMDDRTDPEKFAHCVFELIYIGSPESIIYGKNVTQVRYALGAQLAKRDAASGFFPDAVVPIQHSGMTAAIGYAQEMIQQFLTDPAQFGFDPESDKMLISTIAASFVPQVGLVADNYNGRIFISPNNREALSRAKHRGNPFVLEKKRVVVIDDSIVRGDAIKQAASLARHDPESVNMEGPSEIHVRIAAPPIRHPCFFGVDFSKKKELIANTMSIDALKKEIGVESLHYVSMRGLLEAVIGKEEADNIYGDTFLLSRSGYCDACFSGEYPQQINQELLVAKLP